jgi:hypothetical protein
MGLSLRGPCVVLAARRPEIMIDAQFTWQCNQQEQSASSIRTIGAAGSADRFASIDGRHALEIFAHGKLMTFRGC